jgi:hypothetical protein
VTRMASPVTHTPTSFRSPVGVADEGGNATGVEDAIEISTGDLGRVSQLVTRRIDLGAGVVRPRATTVSKESSALRLTKDTRRRDYQRACSKLQSVPRLGLVLTAAGRALTRVVGGGAVG